MTRILYIGSMNPHSNSYRRCVTLKELDCAVDTIDTDPFLFRRFFSGIQHHLNVGPGISSLNRKVIKMASEKEYDIIWVDNKPYLTKATLKKLAQVGKGAARVNLLTDDPNGKYRRSWRLIRSTARYYDHFFVQREVNIGELKKWGAKKVSLCYRSFDPAFHRPVELNPTTDARFKCAVGFIGTYEDVRAGYIAHLIRQGISVKVTGNGWENGVGWEQIKDNYCGPSVYGEDYIKHINGMDIALHFLRVANRDEQDSRTFEIPACKVFMLAERTALHTMLFEENVEAAFFGSKEELLQKVQYYLAHPEERETIAAKGYEACYTKGYDHKARLKAVLQEVMN